MRFNQKNDLNDRTSFNMMFKMIFGVIMLVVVLQIAFYVWAGVKVMNEVNDNNGSVATTMGKFYKDFKKASE